MICRTRIILLVILLAAFVPQAFAKDAITLDNYHKARKVVVEALEEMGGMDVLDRARGIALKGEGTYDLSARLQGMHPDIDEPVPITEWLVMTTDGRLAYESDTLVNSDAAEHLRYVYDVGQPMLFMDLINRRAFWDAGPGLEDQLSRYARIVPHVLMTEALNSSSLRYLGWEGEHVLSFTLVSGETLTITIKGARLHKVEYLLDMPLLGDAAVRWTYDRYVRVDDLGAYPSRLTVHLADRLLKDIRYTDIRTNVGDHALWSTPEDIEIPKPPKLAGAAAAQVKAPEVRKIAEGVYDIPNLRAGFHVLIVEFDNYLLLVDAPSGWYEMQQLPAMNWASGETSGSVGQRFYDTVTERFPDKPVRYVALTHWHSDHLGGIRPFIAAGASLIVTPVTRDTIAKVARARFSLEPDGLLLEEPPRFMVVDGELTLNERGRRVKFMDVGENPHAAGMLVVWLPQEQILYQSDLFEPVSKSFPAKERIPVMRWFVNWLDESGLKPETILAIHGAGPVTQDQLAEMRALNELAASLQTTSSP